jgi:hypothetical protein
MKKYILRYGGNGIKPKAQVEIIRALPNTRILDDDSPLMLLVEAPLEELEKAMNSLPDWRVAEERFFSLLDKPSKLL